MAEENRASSDISPEEWIEEVARLTARPAEAEIYLQMLFPGGRLVATGFQPRANAQGVQIPLLRQSPSGLGNGGLAISLPRLEEGWYRRAISETGEVCLSVAYHPYGMSYAEMVELRIATSLDFLELVMSEARTQ